MRIGLADVKKRISRAEGELVVTPHLLGPRQLARELEALIALYEAHVGHERAAFPPDRPAELIGDYRLARTLAICLTDWYEWRPAQWPAAASAGEAAALANAEIDNPSRLRLALYDDVNHGADGYLSAETRTAALDAFAARLGITRGALDTLLWLDAEEHAILARTSEAPPTPRELALRYNQRVFEALLSNAAQVELLIPGVSEHGGPPRGTLVKRICFFARTFGVQYDVAFAGASDADTPPHRPGEAPALPRVAEARALYAMPARPPSDAAPSPPAGRDIAITLFGPLEVTGAPQQYGERLARLCRALLGYRRADPTGGPALPGVSGSARVYVRGQPMHLRLDERLLRLVSHSSPAAQSHTDTDTQDQADPSFDSAVEAEFFAEFGALERAGEARGWRLEREPDPVIVGATILVPDFALTRGARRISLEIAGYWRPEYRERKARKLLAAAGAVDVLVAIPRVARDAFAALAGHVPILEYASSPRASALLDLLDTAYDDFPQRLGSLDLAAIDREVQRRGRIPVVESMTLLRCYSRAELARALDHWRRADGTPAQEWQPWVEDVGLCSPDWLRDATDRVRRLVAAAPMGRLPLADVAAALTAGQPAALSERGAETLVRQAGLSVQRSSLFAADALLPEAESAPSLEPAAVPDPSGKANNKRGERQPRPQRQRKTPQNAPVAQPLFPTE